MTEASHLPKENLTHWGPVYGRPVGVSMGLCWPASASLLTSDSRMVDCPACLRLLDLLNRAQPKAPVIAEGVV